MFSVLTTTRGVKCVSTRALKSRAALSYFNSGDVHSMMTLWRGKSTAAKCDAPENNTVVKEEGKSSIADRFIVTTEVTVSKIFPAGFGWQSASVLAENLGYSADSAAFALTTGAGDAVGVFLGHCSYYAAKKALVDQEVNMSVERDTAILLASAAFCSGTAWQPLVDVLQGANLSFGGVFAGTWIGCGTMFYLGLRVGRSLLSGVLSHVNEPSYANSIGDAQLSISIGGATGFFVGTDTAYLPNQNFLINLVGIHDGTAALTGAAIAGSSTALGFYSSQTLQNITMPTGKCWVD